MTETAEKTKATPVKLTDWEKAPDIKSLKQDFTDAKPIHQSQVQKIQEWLDYLNITGVAKMKANPGSSSIQPKLIRKQAEWRYAALSEPYLSTDDLYRAKPVTFEDRDAAKQNQLLLNHQFNVGMDKQAFIDEYVRTLVDEGTAIIRTGWEFIEEEYEEMGPIIEFRVNPAFAQLHQQLEQMKAESPSQYNTDVPDELKQAHDLSMERGLPIEPVKVGEELKTKTRTVVNRPTAEICDFNNVVVDPTALGDIKRARFVVYSFETSKSELERDGKYKNLDFINVSANSILGEPDHKASEGSQTFNFSDEPRKKFVAYEYWGFWDIDGSGVVKPIVATWVGDTLIRMEENPYPDKELPFVVVQYLPVRKSIYGEPDGALLIENQKVIGAVTRGMIDIMGKSANGQTGMAKNLLDATNRRKFDKGLDYEFNPGTDPRMAIHMHTYPEIPASAQFMLNLQSMEAESLTGVKSYNDGVTGASLGDVAAGVRGALDAASKREFGILRRLSKGITAIGRKWISMNAEFLSEEEVVRLTNEEFVTVRRDDLPGNFDLRLTISTPEEDEKKAQEMAFMLQTMGNNMDPELTKMILSDIFRIRKMPDMAKKVEAYKPQPDPLAVEKQQLELELLRAQIAKENAQALSFQANAQLGGAKTNTELAKAQNIQSDTDQKNLDFVEQESGVKQERDLQKTGEQARSQVQLKVLDQQTEAQKQKYGLLKEYIKANKPEMAL